LRTKLNFGLCMVLPSTVRPERRRRCRPFRPGVGGFAGDASSLER
jgi:hypothetical protein